MDNTENLNVSIHLLLIHINGNMSHHTHVKGIQRAEGIQCNCDAVGKRERKKKKCGEQRELDGGKGLRQRDQK